MTMRREYKMEGDRLYQEIEYLTEAQNIDKKCLEVLDEVVLGYLSSLLSSSNEDKDNDDSVEDFIEVLAGYIPEFSQFDRATVSDWFKNRILNNMSASSEPPKSDKIWSDMKDDSSRKKSKKKHHEPSHEATAKCPTKTVCDESTKGYIVSRYSQISNTTFHRPVLPKEEPKKMVRYRDNQVVSMKGERYSCEKTAESEEMKKTYVNLKPLRKYRFH